MADRIRTSMQAATAAGRPGDAPVGSPGNAPGIAPDGPGHRSTSRPAHAGSDDDGQGDGHDDSHGNDEPSGRPGPGPRLEAEWTAAGLVLPDLPRMRRYRVDRIVDQLHQRDLAGILVTDPLNIRYATDTANMQVWAMHNANRYAWVGADARVVLWEFAGCEFMADHAEVVDEVRPAIAASYFSAGPRQDEQADRFVADLLDAAGTGVGPSDRIAVDRCHRRGLLGLAAAGLEVVDGDVVMEHARTIKGPDEVAAMRCAVHACQSTMAEMRAALVPGLTERDVWALLHAGNIRRAGEWIETQILSSGPRTNPWMQEASSRVIRDGDLVALDTDMVGAYGMMVDVSRTWLAGDARPRPDQHRVLDLAGEQLARNLPLLVPGTTFRDLTHRAWFPDPDDWRHYSVLNHGVGQCDEYPEVYFPADWDEWGYDGVVEPGMVFTVEAYVGSRHGGEGAKLEHQVLVTESGPEVLDDFPLDPVA